MIEIKFKPSILGRYFDLKVREQCKSCKRYGFSAQCPPHLPNIDYYKTLLPTYQNGLLVYETFDTDRENWKQLGKSSSLKIHEYLLSKRQELFDEGHIINFILIAGSCKRCDKCTYPCKFPQLSGVPFEGCGINVIRLMKYFGHDIIFPVNNAFKFYRIGAILWD